MPLDISSNAILEKNKLSSNDPWLLLLEITYGAEAPVRICLNNETVFWPASGGDLYYPAIFSLSGLSESKEAEVPSVSLTIQDFDRVLLPFVEEYDGGVGADIVIYIVHSKYLSNATPELQHEFTINDCSVTANHMITFRLGAENLFNRRCPTNRFLKNKCRFEFKGTNCTYSGAGSECAKTYDACETYNNTANYGGFPSIGSSGFIT